MELPTSKPVAEIEAMKEERRQGYRDNRQRIIDHLKTKGLSNAAIAGIVGNIDIETGGTFDYKQRQTKSGNPRDPNVTPGGAYGLFQFDDPGKKAGHETWYKQYLEKTNKADSAESQLDYFLDTINAAADKQNPFYSFSENVGTGNTGTIKGYFQLSEDPKTVSDSITDRFLKPGKPKSDKRRASAEATFAELQPVDPDNQNIDQPGDIVDTGDDVPLPEIEERKFQNVPILRHFFAEGGVPMKEQMEMFEDGGLMDEGGTVDPVSGNDVPFGSMQEEVRDDIPAQLSEGEFVFPADVVRFIGLNNLMQMRQQAKMGLKEMEAMGQMGNSEEATMPDDLPFDINDLDMEDDMDYNTPQEFNTGGMPNPQSGVFYQPATAPTTGVYQPPQMSVAPAPVQAASAQFAAPPRPQQVTTPMIQYQKPDIPFQQFIGGGVEGVEAETVQYKNEAGDIITRRVSKATGELIPGQPPIPDGYVKFDPNAPEKEEVTTTPTTPQTTSVRQQDDDSGERQRAEEEATFGPGGGRLGVAGTIYGVSFDGPGGFKGTVGQVMGRTLGGKDLGPEITVRFQNEDDIFVLNGTEYNTLKTVIDEQGANSNAAQETLDNFKGGGKARANAEEVIKNLTMMSRGDGIMDKLGLGDDDPKIQEVIKTYREHVEEQIAKGNINSKGQIINPFEAGGRGGTGRGTTLGQRPKSPAFRIQEDDPGESGATPPAFRIQEDDPGESGATPSSSSRDFSAPSPSYANMSFGEAGRGGSSSSSRDFSSQALGDKTSGRVGFDEGGLASKPKPKAKKMKRGGLASIK